MKKSTCVRRRLAWMTAAVMIARAAGLAASVERADAFADAASIPAWAKGGIGAAAKTGFMNGYSDGAFHADNLITRAQAVVTLDRVLRSAQDTVIEKSAPCWKTRRSPVTSSLPRP